MWNIATKANRLKNSIANMAKFIFFKRLSERMQPKSYHWPEENHQFLLRKETKHKKKFTHNIKEMRIKS